LALFRLSFTDVAQVLCIVALAGAGVAWSFISDLLLESEVQSLAARETGRSADGWKGVGNWKLICEGTSCRVEASIGGREDPTTISARVANRDTGRALLIEIRTPLGVELARGLTIRIRDQEVVNVGFARCDLRGCVAVFFPEVYLMIAFRNARSLDISYSAAGGGGAVSLGGPAWGIVQAQLPIHGFGAAVSKIR
jgi:invasion protein IalB